MNHSEMGTSSYTMMNCQNEGLPALINHNMQVKLEG